MSGTRCRWTSSVLLIAVDTVSEFVVKKDYWFQVKSFSDTYPSTYYYIFLNGKVFLFCVIEGIDDPLCYCHSGRLFMLAES